VKKKRNENLSTHPVEMLVCMDELQSIIP